MAIEFYKPLEILSNCKATIHVSGKLGLSQAAIELLNIKDNRNVKIGVNKDEKKEENLYLITQKESDEETFPVNKAGKYFYVNTKSLFDKLSLDYKNKKFIYDIVEVEIEGQKMYKLIRRIKDRKK